MTKEDIQDELENRAAFRSVFVEHQNGPGVLAWIGNELGAFSLEPEKIDPLLVAFWNRLLNKIGIVHVDNLFEDVTARCQVANDRDLIKAEQSLKEDV